jgi:hypothetical protein
MFVRPDRRIRPLAPHDRTAGAAMAGPDAGAIRWTDGQHPPIPAVCRERRRVAIGNEETRAFRIGNAFPCLSCFVRGPMNGARIFSVSMMLRSI